MVRGESGDVMETLWAFNRKAAWCRSLNTMFISLIPKKNGAKELKDFRPICLLDNIYNLLAKVMMRRLEKVMRGIISASQGAFLRGRQILDCSLIANECIDGWIKEKSEGLILQIDMEKAYDHVNWNFLISVLRRMGFGRKWYNWIKVCISSPSFAV